MRPAWLVYEDNLEGWSEKRWHFKHFLAILLVNWVRCLAWASLLNTILYIFCYICTISALFLLICDIWTLPLHSWSHGVFWSGPNHLYLIWWDKLCLLGPSHDQFMKGRELWKNVSTKPKKPLDPTMVVEWEADIGKINSWPTKSVDQTIGFQLAEFAHPKDAWVIWLVYMF